MKSSSSGGYPTLQHRSQRVYVLTIPLTAHCWHLTGLLSPTATSSSTCCRHSRWLSIALFLAASSSIVVSIRIVNWIALLADSSRYRCTKIGSRKLHCALEHFIVRQALTLAVLKRSAQVLNFQAALASCPAQLLAHAAVACARTGAVRGQRLELQAQRAPPRRLAAV